MTASVAEQILARVYAVVQTVPGFTNAARGRLAAIEENDLPFANVRRASSQIAIESDELSRHLVMFEVDIFTSGASWETAADALHCAVDTAIVTDAQIAALSHWLTCTGTDTQAEYSEITAGCLTARYVVTCFTATGIPGTSL